MLGRHHRMNSDFQPAGEPGACIRRREDWFAANLHGRTMDRAVRITPIANRMGIPERQRGHICVPWQTIGGDEEWRAGNQIGSGIRRPR